MQFRAIRLSALALTSAVVFSVCGPGVASAQAQTLAQAQTVAQPDSPIVLNKFTKHSSRKKRVRHGRTSYRSRSAKADTHRKTTEETANAEDLAKSGPDKSSAAAGAFAGANAQMLGSEPTSPFDHADAVTKQMLGTTAKPESGDAATTPDASHAAAAEVVPSDQINELDLASTPVAGPAKPITLAKASLEPSTESLTSADGNPWAGTSLIGRIFVAVGGLLTVASAARMFFA